MSPLVMKHDALCELASNSVAKFEKDLAVAAFVGSLSKRNLRARSVFGSYVVSQHFQEHHFCSSKHFSSEECGYCGLNQLNQFETLPTEQISNYPFQVRHTDISYAAHDLAAFSSQDLAPVEDSDINALKTIFGNL